MRASTKAKVGLIRCSRINSMGCGSRVGALMTCRVLGHLSKT